jgi:putative addiction module killer protein
MVIETTPVYDKWFVKLKDLRAKDRIVKRLLRIGFDGNLGDARYVGGGVSEIRIDYGPGYRLYYTLKGQEMILLLLGAQGIGVYFSEGRV